MAEYFSEPVDRYLMAWIRPESWNSKHPLDMRRFYQFIKALRNDSQSPSIPMEFAEKLEAAVKECHPDLTARVISEIASPYFVAAETIFDYESAPPPSDGAGLRSTSEK